MAAILLISCNTAVEPYPVHPLGLAMVAAALQAAGHRVRQLDRLVCGPEDFPHRLAATLAEFAPDCIGLSLRNIDNVDSFSGEAHWYLGQARELTTLLRCLSQAPLVLGGPAFSLMPEAVLEFLGADYGVVGPGEEAFPALLAALARGETPPRIVRGRPGPPRLRPAPDPEILAHYLRASGLANLQSKRGCPFRCAYCSYPTLEGGAFLCKDPEELAEEVLWLHREHGVQQLFFTDSVFNDPDGHCLKVAEALVRRKSPVRWSAFFRPQGLEPEHLALFKAAGCMALELGTDAACDATLAGLGKGFDFAGVLRCVAAARAVDLPVAHFVMFGGPDETSATLEQGLANLARLEHNVVFAFSGIRILPGTVLARRSVAEGVLLEGADLLHPAYYFSPHIAPETLNSRLAAAFQGQRLRFFPPEAARQRMEVLQRFGGRGLLWDRLLEAPPQGYARRRKTLQPQPC